MRHLPLALSQTFEGLPTAAMVLCLSLMSGMLSSAPSFAASHFLLEGTTLQTPTSIAHGRILGQGWKGVDPSQIVQTSMGPKLPNVAFYTTDIPEPGFEKQTLTVHLKDSKVAWVSYNASLTGMDKSERYQTSVAVLAELKRTNGNPDSCVETSGQAVSCRWTQSIAGRQEELTWSFVNANAVTVSLKPIFKEEDAREAAVASLFDDTDQDAGPKDETISKKATKPVALPTTSPATPSTATAKQTSANAFDLRVSKLGGLNEGVTGDNIASGKPVKVSSTGFGWHAVQAVDGNPSTGFHSEVGAGPHWLEIDLGNSENLLAIRIVNRPGYMARLDGAQITLFDQQHNPLFIGPPISGAPAVYQLAGEMAGVRYIRVEHPGAMLTVMEVEALRETE